MKPVKRETLATNRKGLTLLVGLLLLGVMSLIGVVAVDMAVQETRIAKNFEESLIAVAWAEAGVEAARKEIYDSTNPEMPGFGCNGGTDHYYPNSTTAITKRARFCIDLISVTMQADNASQRGSGQDQARTIKVYTYKIDSTVEREDGSEIIPIRRAHAIEQQSRYSL